MAREVAHQVSHQESMIHLFESQKGTFMVRKSRKPKLLEEDDAVPNPYPEFESEVFESYRASNLEPGDFPDLVEGKKYKEWLEKNYPK